MRTVEYERILPDPNVICTVKFRADIPGTDEYATVEIGEFDQGTEVEAAAVGHLRGVLSRRLGEPVELKEKSAATSPDADLIKRLARLADELDGSIEIEYADGWWWVAFTSGENEDWRTDRIGGVDPNRSMRTILARRGDTRDD